MGFSLTEQQRAVVENRGGGLLVSAAAGSGKTRVLVERLLTRVCDEGVDISAFLVITFTNAAAAELRHRIVEELAARLAADPTNHHLRRQTTLVYETQISTIHAFCTSLLRECGHLIDLDPDFRLCDEGEAGILRLAALDSVMERRYETLEDGDDFTRLLDLMSAGRDDSRLMQIAMDIFGKIQSHPYPERWMEEQGDGFRLEGVTDAGKTPWGALLLEDASRQCAHWVGKLQGALSRANGDEKLRKGYAPSLEASIESIARLGAAAQSGWDVAAGNTVVFPRLGGVRNCDDPALQDEIKALRTSCKKRMEKLARLLSDSSAELLDDMRTLAPAIRALFALVTDYGATYGAEKTRRALLDFSDLEHCAVALLVGEDGTPTPLAQQVGARYCELMVDEYQDTNQVQNAIFSALSRRGGNLFMVGDVKQSVYRFRLADPGIFLEKYRTFPPYMEAQLGQPRKIVLSQNFRSRPQVLDGVNFIFRNLMSRAFGEMDYGAEERLSPGKTDWQEAADHRVALNVLNLENLEESDEGKANKNLLEARCAATEMRRMLDEDFPVSTESGTRPVRPSDMVILLRSPNPVLHHYAQALAEQGIAWEADGGGNFFETTEIAVALSLLEIVDNPRQDVPLISVLRSPVYGFSADRLAEIRANAPQGDFYAALEQDSGADCVEFLEELTQLRFGAGDKRSYQLLWDIYEDTNLLGVFSAMEGGDARRGNLLAFYEHARRFEGGGHKGLFGFLTHLHRLRENGNPLTAPRVAAGDGVRILSIHRSKGLEYPVVFLCGLGRQLNREDTKKPVLFHPELGVGPKFLNEGLRVEYPTLARRAVALKVDYEMMAEELRILYVAMTRAKEKLILSCTLAKGGQELAHMAEDAALPVEPQALAAAGTVGQWVLTASLARWDAQALRDAAGLTEPPPAADCGEEWNIRYLDAAQYERVTLADAHPAAAHAARIALPDGFEARLAWQYPFRAAADTPSKLTATQLKGRGLDEETAEDAPPPRKTEERTRGESSKLAFRRPRFAAEEFGLTPTERGTALHLVLQSISFQKTETLKEIQGEIDRMVAGEYITPEQGAAVPPERLLAFFDSPLGREVKASSSLQREFKFSTLEPAGEYYPGLSEGETVLLQGVVDCFYETESGITVLDFKTDRVRPCDAEARARAYAPQLTAYSRALREVTGKPVTRRILWFFALDRGIEVSENANKSLHL